MFMHYSDEIAQCELRVRPQCACLGKALGVRPPQDHDIAATSLLQLIQRRTPWAIWCRTQPCSCRRVRKHRSVAPTQLADLESKDVDFEIAQKTELFG